MLSNDTLLSVKSPIIPHSYFELSPIKAIELAAARIPGAISLAQGIPIVEPASEIRNFIVERIKEGRCDTYSLTNGLQELRDEIANSLAIDGYSFDPDREIIVTAGSIEGITASILALAEPDSDVLLTSPSYTTYQAAVRAARCNPIFVELDEDRGFDLSLEKLERATTSRTKIILISNPNNPTGTVLSKESIEGLVTWCLKRGIWLLVDEVYKDFYYIDSPHYSPISCQHARSCVVRICSFSKAFAMTGWRVGFMHGDAKVIQAILPYHDAMVTCAPVASQYGAIAALRFGAPYIERYKKEFQKRRSVTINFLDQLSDILDYQVPNSSYFVFPRIKDPLPLARDSKALAYDILNKVHLALVPGVAFGPSGEGHLRISFGRSLEDIQEGMTRFSEYVTESQSKKYAAIYKTEHPIKNDRVTTKHSSTLLRLATRKALKILAQTYIKITKPTVIGIIGNRGKTVVKREVIERLSEQEQSVRGSILSYNTDIGLPCSVLNIIPPKGLRDIPRVARSLFRTFFSWSTAPKLLVLEYGFRDVSEANYLLEIAKPEWLIVSGFINERVDSSWNNFVSSVTKVLKEMPASKIVVSKQDLELLDLPEEFTTQLNVITPLTFEGMNSSTQDSNVQTTPIGESQNFAIAVSDLIINRLNFNK